jgi:hypothetical protein
MFKSTERVILAAALLLFAAVAGGLGFFFPSQEEITGVGPGGEGKPVMPLKEESLSEVQKHWEKPAEWTPPANGNRLFVGPKVLYFPDTKTIERPKPGTLIYEIFTLDWLEKYSLDYSQREFMFEDPDGDGFSNLVEYQTQTDPRNPQSHAPFIERLRLKEFEAKPFRYRFQSYNELEGKLVFQINLLDARVKPSRLVKLNEKVDDFVVKEFRKKSETVTSETTNITTVVDVSELDLVNEAIDFKITLILDKTINSPDSTGNFVLLLPPERGQVFKAARGRELIVRSKKYLLKDIVDKGAILRDLMENKDVQIPHLDPKELDQIPGGAPASAETN